jgi:uncharacterized heparinase superfamily protein
MIFAVAILALAVVAVAMWTARKVSRRASTALPAEVERLIFNCGIVV